LQHLVYGSRAGEYVMWAWAIVRRVVGVAVLSVCSLFATWDTDAAHAATLGYYEFRGYGTENCGNNTGGTSDPYSCDTVMWAKLWVRGDGSPERVEYGAFDQSERWDRSSVPDYWTWAYNGGDYEDGWQAWDARWRCVENEPERRYFATYGEALANCEDPVSPMPRSYGLAFRWEGPAHWYFSWGSQPYQVMLGEPWLYERFDGANSRMGLDNYWWATGMMFRVGEPSPLLLALPFLAWLKLAGRRRGRARRDGDKKGTVRCPLSIGCVRSAGDLDQPVEQHRKHCDEQHDRPGVQRRMPGDRVDITGVVDSFRVLVRAHCLSPRFW